MILRSSPSDNVAIVVDEAGVVAGDDVSDELVAKACIPMGHKIALEDLEKGAPILRYGSIIGYAAIDIERGEWVSSKQVILPEPPPLQPVDVYLRETTIPEPVTGFTFEGYRNADGSVGTKNILGVTNSVQCVAAWTRHVVSAIKSRLLAKYPNVDDVVALGHHYGCGVAIDAPAAQIPIKTIQNIARNPNFGGEVMILGLGCEKLRPERILESADLMPSEVEGSILYMQNDELKGYNAMIERSLEIAERHLRRLNARRRESCPASALSVGMQCGGSDTFSGLTGNPVAGYAADLIVRAGGTVMFSEVTEVRDAVHLLTARAKDESVARALVEQIQWYDEYLSRSGAERNANPSPGNKAGGLSNVVEKAIGSIAKSGTTPIVDVVSYGERVRKPGLNFVATPASDFVCGTLQVAAGMNLHLFITGRGSPYGLSMVPVIKIGSNSKLSKRWFDLIDFDAGQVATGQKTVEDLGWRLFHMILDVASGRETVAADRWGLHNDIVLFNPGPLT